MGINKPIIPAGPTIRRAHITDYPIRAYGAAPGESYFNIAANGVDVSFGTVVPPTRQGQVYFHTSLDGANRLAKMYVGVDISGTLTWVEVRLGSYVNRYTGQPFDPIYD